MSSTSVAVDKIVGAVGRRREARGLVGETAEVSLGFAQDQGTGQLPALGHAFVKDEFQGPVFSLELRDVSQLEEDRRGLKGFGVKREGLAWVGVGAGNGRGEGNPVLLGCGLVRSIPVFSGVRGIKDIFEDVRLFPGDEMKTESEILEELVIEADGDFLRDRSLDCRSPPDSD